MALNPEASFAKATVTRMLMRYGYSIDMVEDGIEYWLKPDNDSPIIYLKADHSRIDYLEFERIAEDLDISKWEMDQYFV